MCVLKNNAQNGIRRWWLMNCPRNSVGAGLLEVSPRLL